MEIPKVKGIFVKDNKFEGEPFDVNFKIESLRPLGVISLATTITFTDKVGDSIIGIININKVKSIHEYNWVQELVDIHTGSQEEQENAIRIINYSEVLPNINEIRFKLLPGLFTITIGSPEKRVLLYTEYKTAIRDIFTKEHDEGQIISYLYKDRISFYVRFDNHDCFEEEFLFKEIPTPEQLLETDLNGMNVSFISLSNVVDPEKAQNIKWKALGDFDYLEFTKYPSLKIILKGKHLSHLLKEISKIYPDLTVTQLLEETSSNSDNNKLLLDLLNKYDINFLNTVDLKQVKSKSKPTSPPMRSGSTPTY